MKYVVRTTEGEVVVDAYSSFEAERKVRDSGRTVLGSRTASYTDEQNAASSSVLGIVDFNDGDINFGLGGGLTIDSGGDLGINVGGFDIDIT